LSKFEGDYAWWELREKRKLSWHVLMRSRSILLGVTDENYEILETGCPQNMNWELLHFSVRCRMGDFHCCFRWNVFVSYV